MLQPYYLSPVVTYANTLSVFSEMSARHLMQVFLISL
jgi:hypothetical protein